MFSMLLINLVYIFLLKVNVTEKQLKAVQWLWMQRREIISHSHYFIFEFKSVF
jgi:hypothetical protein